MEEGMKQLNAIARQLNWSFSCNTSRRSRQLPKRFLPILSRSSPGSLHEVLRPGAALAHGKLADQEVGNNLFQTQSYVVGLSVKATSTVRIDLHLWTGGERRSCDHTTENPFTSLLVRGTAHDAEAENKQHGARCNAKAVARSVCL
jgi:hypothetical protein